MPSPILDDLTIQYPPRLLAETMRDLLDRSPSDTVPGLPAGRLKVERAWVPVYKLEAQGETVLSVLCGDDAGDRITRGLTVLGELDLAFSVQRLLSESPHTQAGKEEIDAVVDFAERCMLAAFVPVSVGRQRFTPLRYRRTMLDETILNWNQVSLLFSITYKTVS